MILPRGSQYLSGIFTYKGAEKPIELNGHYVELPQKYTAADTSDLTYTVTPGPQTFDVVLK